MSTREEARESINDFLNAGSVKWSDETGGPPDLSELSIRLDRIPSSLRREILIESIETETGVRRMVAAYLMLLLDSHREEATLAYRAFLDGLQSGDIDQVRYVAESCMSLTLLIEPVTPELSQILHGDNSTLAFLAARIGILTREDSILNRSREILHETLNSSDPELQLEAAMACYRIGIQTGKAWQVLTNYVQQNPDLPAEWLILNFYGIDREAPELEAIFRETINSNEMSVYARVYAVNAAGIAARNSAAARDILLEALRSDVWKLRIEAAGALSRTDKGFPAEGFESLIELLDHSEVVAREAASVSLRAARVPMSEEQYHQVSQKLLSERDIEVLENLLVACEFGRDHSVGALVDAGEQTAGLRRMLIQVTLLKTGAAGRRELFRKIAGSDRGEECGFVAGLIGGYGIGPEDELPELRDMLNSDSEDDTEIALMVLSRAGRTAEPFARDLVRIFAECEEPLLNRVEQILYQIGPGALRFFDDVRPSNFERSRRLSNLRDKIERQGQVVQAVELSWIQDFRLIQCFVCIAEDLQRSGGLSIRGLESSLTAAQDKKVIDPSLGLSGSNIRRVFLEMERLLSERWHRDVKLKTQKGHKQMLTAEGAEVLKLARKYLERTIDGEIHRSR